MIYLICAQDSKRRIVELDSSSDTKTAFYKWFMDITNHKNVMYPYEFYRSVSKAILPNRVNVVFTKERKKHRVPIVNAIVVNNVKEILSTYTNNVDDIYILASTKDIIDYFGNHADYLMVYETDTLGHTVQDITESINFANYNLLKTEHFTHHKISYFVVNPNNYLGN